VSEFSTPSSEPSTSGRASLEERSLHSLDWPRVIEALVERAATGMGEELCRDLSLFMEIDQARDALSEVSEMLGLLEESAAPSVGGVVDMRAEVTAVSKGTILEGSSLLSIAHCLEALERLKTQLLEAAERAPRLYRRSASIQAHPDLAAWLIGSFDPRGELSASTYPQLSSLRGAKAKLHNRIRGTLDGLRGQERFGEALQDDFVAMRNDRYVVPLKASEKRQGFGIVHDTSGSGQTVFVEPLEIVEMNNELKMADAELRSEELRILRDLSERVALIAWDLSESLKAAAAIDLILAKAKLGLDLEATVFSLSEQPGMDLRQARHPILVLQGEDVIANDLQLGSARRALVLSGPNTGGKTISLKTLGLAALFARAAIPFPADEGSTIGWCPGVLTDIGDAQDVREGLSTFSGHVLCLIEIFQSLTSSAPGSLVLIDEIAVGTDPVQGAALGRAVLESLLDAGVLLATTTHYPELKALSSTDDRFVNARVEFDEGAGAPTYRVSVGRPGSSHALDIAARVGLGDQVLKLARSFLGQTAADVEKLLSGLESETAQARDAREEAIKDREEAAAELAQALAERDELKRRSRSLESDLRAEFEREVRGYRDSVRGAMKQLRERADEASAERARQRINEGARVVRDRLGEEAPGPIGDVVPAEEVVVGARVRIATLGKEGVVVELPDRKGRLHIEVDGLRIRAVVGDLERVRPKAKSGSSGAPKGKKGKKGKKGRSSGPGARPETDGLAAGCDGAFRSVDNTLDLRGERVDEALDRVERFLDECYLKDRPHAFILHGLGTGALRAAIRKELRSSAYVKSWQPGSRSQGGEGITVVELKGS
jgi:DNA mismatch repair protein MutS2